MFKVVDSPGSRRKSMENMEMIKMTPDAKSKQTEGRITFFIIVLKICLPLAITKYISYISHSGMAAGEKKLKKGKLKGEKNRILKGSNSTNFALPGASSIVRRKKNDRL